LISTIILIDQVIASAGSDGKIILNHAWKGTNLLSLDDENSRVIILQIFFYVYQSKRLLKSILPGLHQTVNI